MLNPFTKAGDTAKYLKIAATGPSGGGKTVLGLDARNHGMGPVYVFSLEAGEVLYEDHPQWGGFNVIRTNSIEKLEEGLDYLETLTGGTAVVDTVTGIYEALVEAKSKEDGSVNKNAWGLIKRKWKSIMARFVNLRMNVVYVVHENDIVEEDAKGAFKVVGQKLDAEKSFIRNPDFVVRLLRSKDGTKRRAEVLKVRGEQTGLTIGQVIDNPHIGMFAKAIRSGSHTARVAPPEENAEANERAMSKPAPKPAPVPAAPAEPESPRTEPEHGKTMARLLADLAAGFPNWEAKRQWSLDHKAEKTALPAEMQAVLTETFKKAHPVTNPTRDGKPVATSEAA